jgi:hypothetical protein
MSPVRFAICPLGLTVVAMSVALLPGCGSGAFSTRAEGGEPRSSRRAESAEAPAPVAQTPGSTRTQLPEGRVDVTAAWDRGDAAFRAGDFVTAQREFGEVYLADPGYRGGQVRAALVETCTALREDCAFVLGRLDHLRIAYTGTLGQRSQWVAQQETDFRSILDCWDQALAGNYDVAYYAGYSALHAPLPAFSSSAHACVDRVRALQSQAAAYEQQRAAVATWDTSFPAYRTAWRTFEPALLGMDWDAIVDAYPRYKLAEEPVAGVVEGGVLEGDSERAAQVAEAREWLEAVRAWEVEHGEEYTVMRDAIAALDEDPAYNQALLEYEAVHVRVGPIEDEIATLRVARDATSGAERTSIERRIDAKQAEIRDLRRELRRIMASVNNLRQARGLPSREAPHGLE